MGLSPSPTFANVCNEHELYASAHESLEKVIGGLAVHQVIQNWSGWEGVCTKVMVLDMSVLKVNKGYSFWGLAD